MNIQDGVSQPANEKANAPTALGAGSLQKVQAKQELSVQQGNTPIPGKEPIHGCRWVMSAEDVPYLEPVSFHSRPSLEEFYARMQKTVALRGDIEMLKTSTLHYDTSAGARDYPFYMIKSKDIGAHDKILVIRANVHGREIGSALTIYHQLDEMVEYAHKNGVKIVVFPMDNPSAYESMNYRNIEVTEKKLADEPTWPGNNLGVFYVLADGREVGDIGDGKTSIDPKTKRPFEVVGFKLPTESSAAPYVPNECRALHAALKMIPINQVAGVLDLHQDPFCTVPLTYQFAFGENFERYDPILAEVKKSAMLLTDCNNEGHQYSLPDYEATEFSLDGGCVGQETVDAGAAKDELESSVGETVADGATASEDESFSYQDVLDERGMIVHHDGTFVTLFERMGVKDALTIEISSVTPQDKVENVYMSWVRGLVDLIANDGKVS